MAYTTGTAANYKDLIAILRSFALANGWDEMEWNSDTRLYLKGKGLAGLDEIYCGVETYEDTVNNRFNWKMCGSMSYRTGRSPLAAQPMSSGDGKVVSYFWNAAIPYWMVADGRRIMAVAKVSTVYQFVHLGLLTPPATDTQYPYPLYIGGCGYKQDQNYSATSGNSGFWANNNVSGRVCLPGGNWHDNQGTTAGDTSNIASYSYNYNNRANILTAQDGTYLLDQIYVSTYSRTNILGAVEGLFRVSGYNNSAENIITADGVNYMVFPDVYRTTYGDYCAMRLN